MGVVPKFLLVKEKSFNDNTLGLSVLYMDRIIEVQIVRQKALLARS